MTADVKVRAETTAGLLWADRVNEAYYGSLGETMAVKTRDRINWMCSQASGNTVLDVGCSQGIATILLSREGFRVKGVVTNKTTAGAYRGSHRVRRDRCTPARGV